MTKHTPGPLTINGPSRGNSSIDDGGDYCILDQHGKIIGEAIHKVWYDDYRPAKANAQLWAEAGNLLEACKLAEKALVHNVPYQCWATGPDTGDAIADLVVCPGCIALDAIRTAIARATGEADDS